MLSDSAARAALAHQRAAGLVQAYLDAARRDFPAQKHLLSDLRRIVCAFGGVRSGKSEGGARLFALRVWRRSCQLVAAERLGMRPVWSPSRSVPMAGEDEPAAHFWVVGPTYALATVAWRKLVAVLRAAGVRIVRQVEGALWLPGGVLVERRSGGDETQLQGARLDGVWVDEVCALPEASWDQINNRLTDRAGWALVTGSPRPGTWPKYRLWDEGDGPDLGLHHWRTADNPYIDPDEIERARRTMPAKWFRRDFEASWETDEGLVYDEFRWDASPSGNVVPLSAVRGAGIQWWGAVDFGIRRPAVLLCATVPGLATDGGDADVVVDEWVDSEHGNPERIGRELVSLAQARGVSLSAVYCDPAGDGRTQTQDQHTVIGALRESIRAMGADCKVHWPHTAARRSIRNGLVTVAGRIRAEDGHRRLMVVDALDGRRYPPGLVGIAASLRGYRWPDKRPGASEPAKDGVHDHFADALRYALVCRHGVAGEQSAPRAILLSPHAVAEQRRVSY